MFKIAKFEFKVTVHYSQWQNAFSCDPLNTICYDTNIHLELMLPLVYWNQGKGVFYKRIYRIRKKLNWRTTIKENNASLWLILSWVTINVTPSHEIKERGILSTYLKNKKKRWTEGRRLSRKMLHCGQYWAVFQYLARATWPTLLS